MHVSYVTHMPIFTRAEKFEDGGDAADFFCAHRIDGEEEGERGDEISHPPPIWGRM